MKADKFLKKYLPGQELNGSIIQEVTSVNEILQQVIIILSDNDDIETEKTITMDDAFDILGYEKVKN